MLEKGSECKLCAILIISIFSQVAKIVADYRKSLYSGAVTPETNNYTEVKSQVIMILYTAFVGTLY